MGENNICMKLQIVFSYGLDIFIRPFFSMTKKRNTLGSVSEKMNGEGGRKNCFFYLTFKFN